MMPTNPPTETLVSVVQRYLEREFPGQVRRTWWDEDAMAQVYEIQGEVQWQLAVDYGFFEQCPNCAGALSESELADYIRETHSSRCFIVRWTNHEVRVRSKPLVSTDITKQR